MLTPPMEGKISRVALGSRRSCTTRITNRQRKRVLRWWYRGVSTGQVANIGSPQLPINAYRKVGTRPRMSAYLLKVRVHLVASRTVWVPKFRKQA